MYKRQLLVGVEFDDTISGVDVKHGCFDRHMLITAIGSPVSYTHLNALSRIFMRYVLVMLGSLVGLVIDVYKRQVYAVS